MKTKSTRERPAKAKAQPYNDTKRPRKQAVKPRQSRTQPSSSSASPSLPSSSPTTSDTGLVLYRQVALDNVSERYPGLEIRNDFDLLELSGHHYKGTPTEIHAALDEQLADDMELLGYDGLMAACKKVLESYIEPTGIKPKESASDDKFVFIRPIPDSKYSLRLFPGSFSAAEYCLDFVETATGKPVNSPFEYELWGVPNPDADTPWLSIPMCGKLRSIERSHGIKQADILPGEEKYILRDGQTCVLARPGKRSLRFTVPVRKMKSAEVVDDMDVVDLPRYIET